MVRVAVGWAEQQNRPKGADGSGEGIGLEVRVGLTSEPIYSKMVHK